MNKLIRVLAVLLLASLLCLVGIVALSLVGDMSDYTGPSNEAVTRVDPTVPKSTIVPAIKPTPIIPTLEPINKSIDDNIINALIYLDSLLSISDEVADNLNWLSETVVLATDYEGLYTICAVGETDMDLSITKLLALDPTRDLETIHTMFRNSLREFKTAMNKCSLGDFDSFDEHMEIGLGLLDNATALMNLWEPPE